MIQSLERGIRTLVFLSRRKSLGVTEVAKELDVNKSTAFRILETLIAYNMVVQDSVSAKYKLGPGILMLHDQLVKNLNIISIAKPYMAHLVEDTGESSHLCMMSNDSSVIIDQIMSNSVLTVNSKVGNIEPIYCSSVGKCLLAFCDDEKKESILSAINFVSFTKNTITDPDALKKELSEIRERGYAIDDEEMNKDIMCVAAPVYNHLGLVPYSVGLSGLKSRIKERGAEFYAAKLMHATEKISEQLGFYKERKERY